MTNIASLPLRVTLEVRLGLIGMALAIVVSACAKPRPLAAIPEQIENGAETFPIPEFVELDIEAARAEAARTGRRVVVSIHAPWCPPCQDMDLQVWPAPEIREWLRERAVALRSNVHGDVRFELSLGTQGVPAIAALDDAGNWNVLHSFRPAAEILRYLKALDSGKTFADQMRMEMEEARGIDQKRFAQCASDLGRELSRFGRDVEAAHAFGEYWSNRKVYPNIPSNMMTQLAERSLEARAVFAGWLDKQALIEGPLSIDQEQAVSDWAFLCGLTRNSDRFVAWFEALPDTDRAIAKLRYLDLLFYASLATYNWNLAWETSSLPVSGPEVYAESLVERQRILEFYRLYPKHSLPMYESDLDLKSTCQSIGSLYSMLVAMGKFDLANRLESSCLRVVSHEYRGRLLRQLVDGAIRGGVVGEREVQWTREAKRLGEDVSGLLEQSVVLKKAIGGG